MKPLNIKALVKILLLILVIILTTAQSECESGSSSQRADRYFVNDQQKHYAQVQPLHFYDYSIPRDILQQIYDIVTTRAVATYSVAETAGTGALKYQCHSIGYAIPVDTQLTNPLTTYFDSSSSVIEQAEPNGLFSSKNTDGTWVLCVDETGLAYPYYSEHKIQTWPFPVQRAEDGSWHKIPGAASTVVINTESIQRDIEISLQSSSTTNSP